MQDYKILFLNYKREDDRILSYFFPSNVLFKLGECRKEVNNEWRMTEKKRMKSENK